MVGRQSKATVVALSLVVGLAVVPGFALTASTDAEDDAASIARVVGQEDGTNTTQEDDSANTTLDNLTVQTLTMENVTVQDALIEQATVNGDERTNLTSGSVTVENATLTNVTFHNITLTDRELLTLVVGQARATPEQNNSLESLDISDRTVDGLIIEEATVQNASDFQLGEADGEADEADQPTAADAALVIENATVESVTEGATDEVSADETEDDQNETETDE